MHGATPAQINAYGKSFALQNTNPQAGTYQAYNHDHKKTDMDYVRLQGDIGDSLKLDNTVYTYAYVNKTISATNVDADRGRHHRRRHRRQSAPSSMASRFANDVPGYTKQNAYRVWGDILRLSQDFDFGWLTGQVRAGVWWEGSATQRAALRLRPHPVPRQWLQSLAQRTHYADSRHRWRQQDQVRVAIVAALTNMYEHSNWNQYQPFVELELHPIDGPDHHARASNMSTGTTV